MCTVYKILVGPTLTFFKFYLTKQSFSNLKNSEQKDLTKTVKCTLQWEAQKRLINK